MSVENLITEHLDIWTSAIKTRSTAGRGSSKKLELVGVKKLRELILELAVRGKLVPQDPNDEPASELLKKSLENKASLIKDGLLKPSRSKKQIKDEHFYNYPSSWVKANICDLINVLNGRAYKKQEMLSHGTPLLRVGNLFTSNEWYYSDLELEPDKYIDNGDLIYAWSASFGPFIWDGGRTIYHYHIWKMDIYSDESLDKNFSKLFLQAISERIKASGNGIAMIHMTKERMEKVVHPLPPLAEQHRIVAKVDELMALCDQLEKQTESSIQAHQVLVETLLATISNAKNADELNDNWQTISQHFDVLFTTQDSIDQLKQTILQLAVMGKLVKQDPNDEPAAKLLERIAAEKQQLIKDGKIKKQKPLPPITDEEKPFELPVGWISARLGEIGYDIGGGTPSKSNSNYWGGDIPWVSPKDMKLDFIEDSIDKVTELAIENSSIKPIPLGSLLFVVRGMILAHSFPVAITRTNVVINQDMKALVFSEINENYILLLMKSLKSSVVDIVDRSSHGTCKLVSEKLWSIVLSIPPVEEQHRIVAKVDELMALCDSLKTKLNQAQTTQLYLTDSIVEQALN